MNGYLSSAYSPRKRFMILWTALGLCCYFLYACKTQKAATSSPAPTPTPTHSSAVVNTSEQAGSSDPALEAIGKKLAAAVLAKDIKTVLAYDRADLRAEDEALLQDPNSGLYRFLFYSGSYEKDEAHSIYDILATARQLQIQSNVMKSPANGKTYGALVFYDRSLVSEASLESNDYMCSKESLKTVASWTFELDRGKWVSSTTLFGWETEGLCHIEDD